MGKTRSKRAKRAKKSSFGSFIAKLFLAIVIVGVLGVAAMGVMNVIVIQSSKSDIYGIDDFTASHEQYDAVIVLGCAVYKDGTPSPMLADRLRTAAEVYKTGCAGYLLVSGDGKDPSDYDEISAMKEFLIDEGIPESDLVCDPLGVSTYETMRRAFTEYGIKSAVVVTTDYHLSRAVYDCQKFGIVSVGVEATLPGYVIQPYNYFREFIARAKDCVFMVIKPEKDFLN